MLLIMTPLSEFKLNCMENLVSSIKLDLYDTIDQVLLEKSHYIIASDFDDPVNHILVEIEKMHYMDSPEESFVATVSPDNISVFFLNRNQISETELAVHLHMTPTELKEYAPSGFVFIASKSFKDKFQEYFDEEQIIQVPHFGSSSSIH